MVLKSVLTLFLTSSISLFEKSVSSNNKPPNIVFMLADDLGWADVSWNNERISTPHLEKLVEASTLLTSLYTLPVCTPSRAALLTGQYPFRFGLQRGFGDLAPNGLPTDIKLLPSYLKEMGYSTHMLGKWHLGHCDTRYTPTYRGFDSFFGSYSGAVDHWSREGGSGKNVGYDLRNGTRISHYGDGLLSSDLYSKLAVDIINGQSKSNDPYFLYVSFTMVHAPFQDVTKKNSLKQDVSKNIRDGMIKALDQAVGEINKAVKSQSNTILIFMSDNGGRNYPGIETNLPLRGGKAQVYEGGTRVVGMVQGPGFQQNKRYNGLMHMVDWLPTLVSWAGGNTSWHSSLDGLDMSQDIIQAENDKSPRHEMVYNIDENNFHPGPGSSPELWQVGIRRGQYKLIWGQAGMLKKTSRNKIFQAKSKVQKINAWNLMGQNNRTESGDDDDMLLELFNLESDPYEQNNLAKKKSYQEILKDLKQRTLKLASEMTPVVSVNTVSLGSPKNLGGNVGSGWCLAVKKHHCSNDTETLENLLERRGGEGKHNFVMGQAYLYQSPLLKDKKRACFLSMEEGNNLLKTIS